MYYNIILWHEFHTLIPKFENGIDDLIKVCKMYIGDSHMSHYMLYYISTVI